MFFSYGNSWALLSFWKAYVWTTGTRFCHYCTASPRPRTKKLAMSPSSTVHGGQYDTHYVTIPVTIEHGIHGGHTLRARSLNQLLGGLGYS